MANFGRVSLILIALTSMMLIFPSARAWSNGGYSADQNNPDYGTHDWIADMAITFQTRDMTFLSSTYHTEFLLGTEAPDNPDFIGDTANHHVYYYSTLAVQDDACAVRAQTVYETALDFMLDGDYHSAAFDIGVMAHYIADPGVFGHTMGVYTDWGAEVHHADYESEFESRLGSLVPPTGQMLGDNNAYQATLDLAKNITFGQGIIKSNVWMDQNYNWSDSVFEASAIESLNASVHAVASAINHMMIEANISGPTIQAPDPPNSITCSLDGHHVVLSWLPPDSDGGSPITQYVILRAVSEGTPKSVAFVSNTTLTWTDESPVRGTTNFYWVFAENSVGRCQAPLAIEADVPGKPNQLAMAITVFAASVLAASGGILVWRRATRSRPET